MIHLGTGITACALVVALFLASPADAAGKRKKSTPTPKAWSVSDTVSAAMNYSPVVKSRLEGVRMAEESVRQAKAGHLPRVDVEASTGASTLPVYKYDK